MRSPPYFHKIEKRGHRRYTWLLTSTDLAVLRPPEAPSPPQTGSVSASPVLARPPFLELGAVTRCVSSWGCEHIGPSTPGHLGNQLRPWELGPWAVEGTRTSPGPPVLLQPRRPFSPEGQSQRQPWSMGIFLQHSPGSSPGRGRQEVWQGRATGGA